MRLRTETNQTSSTLVEHSAWTAVAGDPLMRSMAFAGVLLSPSTFDAATHAVEAFPQWEVRGPSREVNHDVHVAHLWPEAISALGENGAQRFGRFRQYGSGWDGGNGKPLDLRSVSALNEFTSAFTGFAGPVSLFMTQEGYLQLGWTHPKAGVIEVDMLPGRIVCFVERLDEEREYQASSSGITALKRDLQEAVA